MSALFDPIEILDIGFVVSYFLVTVVVFLLEEEG